MTMQQSYQEDEKYTQWAAACVDLASNVTCDAVRALEKVSDTLHGLSFEFNDELQLCEEGLDAVAVIRHALEKFPDADDTATNIGGIAKLIASFVGHMATAHDNVMEFIKAGRKLAGCELTNNLHRREAGGGVSCAQQGPGPCGSSPPKSSRRAAPTTMLDDIKKISNEVNSKLTQKSQTLVEECETTL